VRGAERFLQEIKTTASMSDPHILPLFDSGTFDGFRFSVSALAQLAPRLGQCRGRVLLSQIPLVEPQPHHRRAGVEIRCSR
jgi:hypothetical protein